MMLKATILGLFGCATLGTNAMEAVEQLARMVSKPCVEHEYSKKAEKAESRGDWLQAANLYKQQTECGIDLTDREQVHLQRTFRDAANDMIREWHLLKQTQPGCPAQLALEKSLHKLNGDGLRLSKNYFARQAGMEREEDGKAWKEMTLTTDNYRAVLFYHFMLWQSWHKFTQYTRWVPEDADPVRAQRQRDLQAQLTRKAELGRAHAGKNFMRAFRLVLAYYMRLGGNNKVAVAKGMIIFAKTLGFNPVTGEINPAANDMVKPGGGAPVAKKASKEERKNSLATDAGLSKVTDDAVDGGAGSTVSTDGADATVDVETSGNDDAAIDQAGGDAVDAGADDGSDSAASATTSSPGKVTIPDFDNEFSKDNDVNPGKVTIPDFDTDFSKIAGANPGKVTIPDFDTDFSKVAGATPGKVVVPDFGIHDFHKDDKLVGKLHGDEWKPETHKKTNKKHRKNRKHHHGKGNKIQNLIAKFGRTPVFKEGTHVAARRPSVIAAEKKAIVTNADVLEGQEVQRGPAPVESGTGIETQKLLGAVSSNGGGDDSQNRDSTSGDNSGSAGSDVSIASIWGSDDESWLDSNSDDDDDGLEKSAIVSKAKRIRVHRSSSSAVAAATGVAAAASYGEVVKLSSLPTPDDVQEVVSSRNTNPLGFKRRAPALRKKGPPRKNRRRDGAASALRAATAQAVVGSE